MSAARQVHPPPSGVVATATDAETCVLSRLLGVTGRSAQSQLDAAGVVLAVEDFSTPDDQVIFRRIVEAQGQEGDVVDIVGGLLRGRQHTIHRLTQIIESEQFGSVVDAAKTVAREGKRRARAAKLAKAMADHRAGHIDADEMFARVHEITAVEVPTATIKPAFDFLTPEQMLELQGEPDWVVRGLGICPGRPCAIVGEGGAGKSIFAGLLAASVCTGTRFLGHFFCGQAPVIWIDFEMGKRATLRRMQRLCRGHGLDMSEVVQRLKIAIYPRTFLNSPECESELVRAVTGSRLCFVDSLRRSLPGIDENDSRVADYLQMLSRVSETTGCAFVFIHHASTKGDSSNRDKRSSARGSSAIYDGSGSYILISGPENTPPLVSHVREPQEGAKFDPFHIRIVDAANGNDPKHGLRVEYLTPEQVNPPEAPSRQTDADIRTIVAALAKNPPVGSIDAIVRLAGINLTRGRDAVHIAISRGEILRSGTAREPRFSVRPPDVEGRQ